MQQDDSRGSAPNEGRLYVGDLVRLTGVSKGTIEHYLRLGLVEPAAVGRQGYRLFTEETVKRLEAIRAGRRAGFTLRETRAALARVDPTALKELFDASPPSRCRTALAARGVALER